MHLSAHTPAQPSGVTGYCDLDISQDAGATWSPFDTSEPWGSPLDYGSVPFTDGQTQVRSSFTWNATPEKGVAVAIPAPPFP